MKIELLQIGKTDDAWLKSGIEDYERRIQKMTPFTITTLPDIKNKGTENASTIKSLEGKNILKTIAKDDYVVLLDERGTQFTSVAFAQWLEHKQATTKKTVFVIGGAFGFSGEVYERGDFLLALSPMTFSYQMVRLVFSEQLYRALTIIKGIPYHHQ